MKRFFFLICIASFPLFLHAADNPVDVIETQQYDKTMCVERNADDCINLQCSSGPFSGDRNCVPNCREKAKAKCNAS